MPWSESVSGAMGGVRQVNLALVMLCVLLALPTIALQENEDQLNKDEGVVDKLIPGTTEGNYSWVEWGSVAMCPLGSFAFAFRLKTEPVMLLGDFTGLNGITLYCQEKSTGKLRPCVTSKIGKWGLWGDIFMCAAGFLKGARMRVEQPWEAPRGDKSAVNNVAMECQDGERMVGDGTNRGQWGEWQECPEGSAICGLATQVVPPQPIFADDVSLISAAFYCCRI
ncbi:vitelline membrane outer layer protein 1 homolog [Scylla paramamosain]|uniref:vitelline membrane outer layer protein 1 homolog n=1 Tax=Scylla paramamosain TaxID=85552 RepID=UPI0030832B89